MAITWGAAALQITWHTSSEHDNSMCNVKMSFSAKHITLSLFFQGIGVLYFSWIYEGA